MRRAVIIWNPKSAAHRRSLRPAEIDFVVGGLTRRGVEVDVWETTGPHAATELARRAVVEGVDLVVARGGDGTLNEVLQGMAGSDVPLALWPGGTANVLAVELGISPDPQSLLETIEAGRTRRINVGRAGERYFFLMAGVGLDASIVRGVRPELKARIGEGAFWLSGIQHYIAWRPEPFHVRVDGDEYEGAFAAIGNATRYGGGFRVTPRASLDEAVLDVCIFPTRRFAAFYARDLLAVMLGDPTRFGDVIYVKAHSLEVEGAPSAQPWVQVDGELHGQAPMRFESVPDAITILVPAS